MTYRDIHNRLELYIDDFDADCMTEALMAEVRKLTGRYPRYRDEAPDWAKDFLKRKGYRI